MVKKDSENIIPESICTKCGLCCDGTIFNTVSVSEHEKQRLGGVLNVAQTGNGGAFDLPCCAFKSGLCSIYQEKPSACAKYRCKLLKNVEAGRLSRREAEGIILEVKVMRANIARAVCNEVPSLAGRSLPGKMAAFERHFGEKMPAVQFRKTFAVLLLDYFILNKRLKDHFLRPKKIDGSS